MKRQTASRSPKRVVRFEMLCLRCVAQGVKTRGLSAWFLYNVTRRFNVGQQREHLCKRSPTGVTIEIKFVTRVLHEGMLLTCLPQHEKTLETEDSYG